MESSVFLTRRAFSPVLQAIARDLGCKLEGNAHETAVADEQLGTFIQFYNALQQKAPLFEYLAEKFDPSRDLHCVRYYGKEYIAAHTVNRNPNPELTNSIDTIQTCWPTAWANAFPRTNNFPGRVLGWLRHAGYGRYYVEAVAFAQVDVFAAPEATRPEASLTTGAHAKLPVRASDQLLAGVRAAPSP
jgi:hypothetical protein